MMRHDEVCSSAIFVDHRFPISTLKAKDRLRTEQKSKISYPNSNQKRGIYDVCICEDTNTGMYVMHVHIKHTHNDALPNLGSPNVSDT